MFKLQQLQRTTKERVRVGAGIPGAYVACLFKGKQKAKLVERRWGRFRLDQQTKILGAVMASSDLVRRLEVAASNMMLVQNTTSFRAINANPALRDRYLTAHSLAEKWRLKAEPLLGLLDDDALEPLVVLMEQLFVLADRQNAPPGQSIQDALRGHVLQFKSSVPLLAYGLLDAANITGLTLEAFPKARAQALDDIQKARSDAKLEIQERSDAALKDLISFSEETHKGIRNRVEDAEKDLELVRTQARKISVDSAQKQFENAERSLKFKASWWSAGTTFLFAAFFGVLMLFYLYPPSLISQVLEALRPRSAAAPLPVSIPLLITASAYFTGIRLAGLGVLAAAFAFSLRMTRSYFHMAEHNQHKLRVTNSIEAFVAAVRTDEQKDLVLSKLVESVTQFGDTGILGDKIDSGSLPSIVFETMTKNVGKHD